MPARDNDHTLTTVREKNQRLADWVMPLWLLCLFLTALLTQAVHNNSVERLQASFDSQSLRIADDISRRFAVPLMGLKGARGVYAASEDVNRAEFRKYVESRSLQDDFAGVRGMGFIERVPRGDLATFVARERADGAPDFAIRSLSEAELLIST